MSTASELLSHLRRTGIKLWADGDQLRCSAPHGVLTPSILVELRTHKVSILKLLEDLKAGAIATASPITRASNDRELPLSFAQQRLWFIDQLEPNSSLYSIPLGLRLIGPLDVAILERCLNEIVRRHEVLRTTFRTMAGEPVQQVGPATPLTLTLKDLTSLPEAEREDEVRRQLAEEAQRPFDLSQDLMLRAGLLRLDEQEHVCSITFHHIAADGWSQEVFFRELEALYEAFSRGEPSPLTDLPIQYADFAVWQRMWLRGDVLDEQLAYWKRHLEGGPPVLELPMDHPRPAMQTSRGAQECLLFDKRLSEALSQLSRREGATDFMTLLAAFQTLLYRYSGQEDVVVGTPIAGRNRLETENVIGLFVNTLALRTDLSGNPTFRELLAQVRETTLGAYAHQDLPFEKLVDELNPERNLGHSPLFQVMFVQEAPSELPRIPGLRVSSAAVENHTAKFDLTLAMTADGEGLRGVLEYNTDLFEPGTIQRMLRHFQMLLEGIAADPDQRVSELPLLTEAERCQLLVEWNDTRTDYPRDRCIHELFEEQAERTPETVAVVYEDQQLTYLELNSRANRLAHYLRQLGVCPDDLVAVYMDRSLELVVALLGILKAGGAYLPMDLAYPPDRLSFMLHDSQAPVLLTQRKFVERLPIYAGKIVCLDVDWACIGRAPDGNAAPAAAPANLAYVIYTSGSTGTPKGVAIEHRSTVAFIKWAQGVFTAEELSGVLGSTSICFDLSVYEFFVPLSSGGLVVLVDNALGLPSLSLEANVRLINTVPSAMAELLRLNAVPDSVVTVNLAGEPLSTELVNAIYRQTRVKRVYDLYGPSEDTTYSTYALRLPEVPARIGRPIADTQVYVLDKYQQLVPVGVPGELYIGGAGLARGYLNRPELTAEKFIANPIPGACSTRLYRTGDLVRYHPDGNLEYLGRLDHQVKIRGFRIELGEVETCLRRHPAIQDLVVLAREDVAGDKRLVAYVVPYKREAGPGELRGYLQEKLPQYMVPSAFVFLDRLPLTPNGKLDRRALPAPDQARPDLGTGYVPPRDAVEEQLAAIWVDLLGVERVGVYDNFFELGGHSLLATRVVSQVRGVLQVEMPVRSLFETPTIAGLAESIEEARGKPDTTSVVPLRPFSREEALPLSFAQQRLWFLAQLEPESTAYNMPYAVRLRGPLDPSVLLRGFDEIVRRHGVLRTVFEVQKGTPVQVVRPPNVFVPTTEDLRDLADDRRAAALNDRIDAEAARPFDLRRDVPLRVVLLCLAEEEFVLLVTLHHVASDGWSLGLVWRELSALYTAYAQGKPSPLPELPIQYADFAIWQRTWLQGAVLERQLGYWRTQLRDLTPLEFPTDRPRAPDPSYAGEHCEFALDADLVQQLRSLGHSDGTTLYMTLLSAFFVLLSRYSGQQDIAVGTPIANRNRRELEGLVGFFVNTLVMRVDLSGDPSFREVLARVRQVTLEAYDHQDLPFEKLVEDLQPERHLSRHPLFQFLFAMQNAPEGDLTLPGVHVSQVTGNSQRVRFDLELHLQEAGQGLQGEILYSTTLFDAGTIRRLADHYCRLLDGIVADPDQRVSELPLLTETERHQLLVEWNDTWTDYPRDRCIHELFEEQVELTPEAVAMVFQDQELTYRQLNSRANQLAHYLRQLGVRQETRVGICVDRSVEMVVGVLAILKAGGAYVPMDPTYPQERLAFMLDDADVGIILSKCDLAGRLPDGNRKVVGRDRDRACIAGCSDANPDIKLGADNLAYVMYTSGSTGRPKGVGVVHRGVVRLVKGTDYVELGRNEVFLQFAPLSFDASTFEIWAPLLNGGRLVVFPPGPASLAELGDCIENHHITTLWLTAGLFHELTEERLDCLKGLRQLVVGGDVVSPRHAIQALRRLKLRRLINGYGPTENTTFSCCHAMCLPDDVGVSVAIGRPIANTQVYVLDRHQQPVPVGVPGELYVGGDGLARGYHNRPDLTAERFVPNPFCATSGSRLYKTGDSVRWLPDGNLEFLGRLDHQVKIRGFRIELEEVESCLRHHPLLQGAVVVAREDVPGDKRLVAYVVPHEREVGPGKLRGYLQEKLPHYMVPSAFVFLERLPLTPNGKLDRRALPAPDQARPDLGTGYVPPRDAVEEQLAAIWADLLGVERVGVYDNFFELGGHSLLVFRMLARVEESFGKELQPVAVFRWPTIAQLALGLQDMMDTRSAAVVLEFQPGGSKPPLFLLPSIAGRPEYFRGLVKYLGPDQPVLGIGFPDPQRPPRQFAKFEDLALWCVERIRESRPVGPYSLAGYSFSGMLAYEVACQLRATGSEVRLVAILDTGPQPKRSFGRLVRYPWLVLKNLPFWISEDILRTSLRETIARLKRAFKAWTRHATGISAVIGASRVEVERIWDVKGMASSHRKILEDNLQLFRAYVPKPYPGRIMLFRARARPLLHSLEHDLNWGELVAGGVEINDLPGNHVDLLCEPGMRAFAERLVERLSESA
ncbi:MAG: amino acid adenylation domain-containing protein [Thermoguttaceae bacterium]